MALTRYAGDRFNGLESEKNALLAQVMDGAFFTAYDTNISYTKTSGSWRRCSSLGMPTGGLSGQSLVKSSSSDYDTEWRTISGGSGGGVNYVPTGGLINQVLAKASNANYDLIWVNASGSTGTGNLYTQTIYTGVTNSFQSVITGLNLSANAWSVGVIEEWDAITSGTDPYFTGVSLLMHFNEAHGSTTFTDSSLNSFAATSAFATISTGQSKFGGASVAFNGTNESVIVDNSSLFDFGSQDYTVEYWEYRVDSGSLRGVLARDNNPTFTPYLMGFYNDGVSTGLGFFASTDGANWDVAAGDNMGAPILNQWTHYAVSRQGSNTRLFQNGTGTATISASYTLSNGVAQGIQVGAYSSYWFSGYIDELRVTKGYGRYSGNFTPSTGEFSNYATQNATKYLATVGGLNDSGVDYGIEKLSDTSLKVRKMAPTAQPVSGYLSSTIDRVYVNVLNYGQGGNYSGASGLSGTSGTSGSSGSSGSSGTSGVNGTSGTSGVSGVSGTSGSSGSSGSSGISISGASGLSGTSGTSGVTGPSGSTGPSGLSQGLCTAMSIQYPTAAENITLFFTNTGITITRIDDVINGVSPASISWNLNFANARNSNFPTGIFSTGRMTNSLSGVSATSFTNPNIPANSWIWFQSSGIQSGITEFSLTVRAS